MPKFQRAGGAGSHDGSRLVWCLHGDGQDQLAGALALAQDLEALLRRGCNRVGIQKDFLARISESGVIASGFARNRDDMKWDYKKREHTHTHTQPLPTAAKLLPCQ